MQFPKLTTEFILDRLKPPIGKINLVMDTDTYNEIDDQFAVTYALRSSERLNVRAIYAAPFHNDKSDSPADGMEKSYEEILRVLSRLEVNPKDFVFKGSDRYLESIDTPCRSEAALDLVKRAMESDGPLYVVSIAAITNIASAILIEPKIIEKIVIVWLGGHALYWPDTVEFNLMQDVLAAQVIFNCGVPLIQIPCMNVASHLLTNLAELERYIDGKSPIGSYLTEIFRESTTDHFAWSKEIWDISAVAYLVNSEWIPTNVVHSPILTDNITWSLDSSRHFIRTAQYIKRNEIFKDLFSKI